MRSGYTFVTIIVLGFFVMLGAMSFASIERDRQDQEYSIDCINSGGQMTNEWGRKPLCINK